MKDPVAVDVDVSVSDFPLKEYYQEVDDKSIQSVPIALPQLSRHGTTASPLTTHDLINQCCGDGFSPAASALLYEDDV
jgi:hypothetical protein